MANVVDQLLSDLSPRELDQLRKMLKARATEEEQKVPDEPLKSPVAFYNPRYRWERFLVPGRKRMDKFMNGKYVARTTQELAVLKSKASRCGWVFEGEDRPANNPLVDDRGKHWLNSKAYEWHMKQRAQ